MRSLLMMVVIVVSVVDAIAQQSMASLLSLTRKCLLTAYPNITVFPVEEFSAMEHRRRSVPPPTKRPANRPLLVICQAIKEWIPNDDPDLNGATRKGSSPAQSPSASALPSKANS